MKITSKTTIIRKILQIALAMVVSSFVVFFIASIVPKTNAIQENYGKIIVIGDSYSRGQNTASDEFESYRYSWPNLMLSKLQISSDSLLGDDTGRRGGAGFCADGSRVYNSDHEVNFVRQLTDITTNREWSTSFKSVKYIIVIGGYNDATGKDYFGNNCNKQAIKDEIAKFSIIARANFPNAKIVIGMAGWSWDNANIQNLIKTKALSAYQEAAAENGLYYISGIENVLKDSSYNSGDNIHPNYAGQNKLAEYIAEYIHNDATSKTGVSSDTIPGNYKLATVSKDNGVHMTNANPNLDFDAADPYMVKSDDNYYYVYSTDEGCHRSKDLNTWEVCDGTISGKPAETDYVWTPKVYQINGRYYMFASFIHWGRGYPYCANSWGFVGVAVADRLNEGFKYLGSIDSKISTLRLGQQSCGNGDPYHDNYNFIDGNLLIDSKYYFYYKVEQSQNIYAIQLAYDPSVSSHFRTVSSSPTWILRKNNTDSDTWGNGVSESPMVWRHHGYYSMTYSSGNYKGDGYPSGIYASGYAWASSPLSYWTNQSTDEKAPFLMGANTFFVNGGMYGGQNNPGTSGSIYAPGAVMVYRAYDDNRGNTSEWYGVYHSGHYDDSNLFDYRKLNFQRMGTSDGAVYINGVNNNYQPLISGTVYEGESYAQLRDESMTISTDGTEVRDYLYDGAIFNANSGLKSWSVPKVSNVSEITIKFKERYDLTDIWISTDGASLAGNSAIVYVNESGEQPYYFIVSDFKNLLGDNAYKKLQLPNSASVSGGYKEIRIHFTKPVNLTEVTPIRRISSVAENTLTSGAGLVVKNTSTVGYAKIAPTTTKTSEPAKSEEASKEKLEEDLSSKSEEVAKRELEEGSSNDMARGESFSDSGNDEEISPSVAVVTNTDIDTDTDVNIDTAVTAEDNGTDQLIFDCAENENCVLNRVAGGKVISEMELEATGSEQTSPVSGKLNEYLEEDNASMLDIILFVLCIGVIIALIVLICVFKRIQKQSQGRIY